MDLKTAQQVVITQADTAQADAFLARLEKQAAPVPGQVTSLLLALKVIHDRLEGQQIERRLAYALHQLAYQGRQHYQRGQQAQVEWPPLLDADLERIAIAVAQIFKGTV